MLPLTRPARQALATLGLLAFAVIPTCYVVFTAWAISRPSHVRQVEAEFRRELGLAVSIETVRYPKPGEVVFGGLVIRQDDARRTGPAVVARADSVRLNRSTGDLTLEASGLRVRGDGAELLLSQVNAVLRRLSSSSVRRVALAIPGCEIDLGPEGKSTKYRLSDVAGELLTDRGNPKAKVSYRMADDRGSTRCELTYTRDAQTSPARTSIAFKTMEGPPIDASILNPFFDSRSWLGEGSRVWGSLTLSQVGNSEWTGHFQGDLTEINLASLVSERFPAHRLSGKAKLSLKSARWGDRPGQGFGWVEAEGELTAGQGSVSPSLVQALASEMQFRTTAKVQNQEQGRDLEFRALGASFHLNHDGEIRVAGALGGEYNPDGILVALNQVSPMASAPQGTANVRGLIKAMFPGDASTLVPGTAESQVVQRYLPLPPGLADSRTQTLGGN
ncbi:hypothetical protein EP7_003706 [Isosphaeraceae bacterium EP7]